MTSSINDRVIYFDYIRIIAIMLVVACHCFGDVDNVSPAVISILTYLEMPCIGLFITLSGALLLPIKLSPKNFIKRRLSKIFIPTFLWSLIYLCLGNRLNINNLPNYILKVFFTFSTALAISWLISYLPFSEYIISFRQKFNRKFEK